MSEKLLDSDESKIPFYIAKGWAAYRYGNREYVELFRKAEQECYRRKDYAQLVNIHPFLLVDYFLRGQKNKADSIVKNTTEYDKKANYAIFTAQFVNYFTAIENYKKAKEIAIYGLNINKESNGNLILKDIYHCLYQINLKQKNYKEALYDLEQYNNLKDSMNVRETLYSLVENEMKQENEKQQFEQQQQLSKLESDKKIQRYLGGAGLLFLSIFSFVFYKRYQEKIKANQEITEAHAQSEALLLNILPSEVATELKAYGKTAAQEIAAATVLFTDIQNFTQQCETMNAAEIVAELDYCFSAFDRIIAKYPIEKIKTVGDAYVCASGLPQPVATHAQDCVRAALEMQTFMLQYKIDREAIGKPFFEMRIGINTGHLVAGIVGIKKFAYDIWGDTVNLAARMEQSGEVGKVNISENTYQLVNQDFVCIFRGKIEAKNKGEVNMYFVEK
jgi:adenylate cyclase